MKKFWVFWAALLLFSYPAKAENRAIISIVDTGISITDKVYPYLCRLPHTDLTGKGAMRDVNGHGSMVADVITSGLDPREYCIQVIKWVHGETGTPGNLGKAMKIAADSAPRIINVSASGLAPRNPLELQAVQFALSRKITLVIAAGNEHLNLSAACDAYPACYPVVSDFFRVVADYLSGYKAPYTNYGGPVTDTEDGRWRFADQDWSGTSVAAAKLTNRIAKQHAYAKNRK